MDVYSHKPVELSIGSGATFSGIAEDVYDIKDGDHLLVTGEFVGVSMDGDILLEATDIIDYGYIDLEYIDDEPLFPF